MARECEPKSWAASSSPISFKSALSQESGEEPKHKASLMSSETEKVVQGTATVSAATINLVSAMVGAGVLALPSLFKQCGWVVTTVLLIICGFAITEVGIVICKNLEWSENIAKAYPSGYSFGTRPDKFEDMCEVAFGATGKKTCFFLLSTLLILICGAYMILIGQSMAYITAYDYKKCVLCMTVIFLPLSLVDNMSLISKLSGAGVVCSILYVLCICAASFSNEYHGGHDVEFAKAMSRIGPVISVMFMGFTYQPVVPTLRSEMANSKSMPDAVRYACSIVTVIYLLVGLAGFKGYGLDVEDELLKSMKRGGEKIVEGYILSAAIVVNLMVTIPLVLSSVSRAIEKFTGGGYSAWKRLAICLTSLCIGYNCPHFLEIFSLIASLLCVPICVLIPVLCFWKLQGRGDDPSHDAGSILRVVRVVKHVFIVIIAVSVVIFGTLAAVQDLSKAMKKPEQHLE